MILYDLRGPRLCLKAMTVFALLLVTLIAAVVGAVVVSLVRESRRWRKFRSLMREWLDERERRESS